MLVGASVMLAIAAIHILRPGDFLSGNWYKLYYSYVSDILLPFGFYFLLCMNEIRIKFLRPWYSKVLFVFVLATSIEILQAFGTYILGKTFDVLDIVMFGIWALLAALLDKKVFEKSVAFWKYE